MTVAHSGRWAGGVWKLAPCLVAMEAQADALAPDRKRISDGSIGDHAHSVRRSDHNPDEEGQTDWVDALDITHDPDGGMDIHARLRQIAKRVQSGDEKRVSYLISNREIFSQRNGMWAWRPYTGINGHTQHGHISVNDEHRQDTSPWFTTSPAPPPTTDAVPDIQEDDEMYMRNTETGEIYAVSATHYQPLSAAQWDDRVKEGAGPQLLQLPPAMVFHFAKSRIRVD